MHKLCDYLHKELQELEEKVSNGQQISMNELQYGDTLAHCKKSLLMIEGMEGDEGASGDSSYARRRNARGQFSRNGSYDRGSYDDYSGYSRRNMDGNSNDQWGSSRDSRDEMKHHLEKAFQAAGSNAERDEIRRLMMR